MKNNNKLIEYFDYFAIRIPRYPIDNYLEKENKSFIDIFKEDLEFQESIFWASPRLYNSAIHYNGDLNMFEKINNSLKNYYKRMSTRATPFGSFSGFTIGKFDYENSLNNNYTFKKNYKISYVWMNKFIKKLESTYDYIKFFKVKFNNNTYEKGYRLYLYESIDKSDISSIEYTQQINLIKQLTYNEIKISMLVDILRERYGEEHFNKIITLVMNLIECGYLISELRKERLELDGIVKKLPLLEYTSDIVVNIQFINDKIKALNYQSKFNINDAIILIKSMEKIEKSEEYIQVDTKIENFNFKLDKNIAESICEYYDWLLKSSVTKAEYSQLQEKFIASFIDKYGENTPIPIYKLYMSGFGLEELLFKLKNNSVLKLDNLNVIILKKITDCFANNQDEISLDDIDIFKSTDPIENCSTDLEIYGRVINENGRNIFVINTSNSSDTVGSSFGRFFDIIDNDSFIKALKKYYSDSDV